MKNIKIFKASDAAALQDEVNNFIKQHNLETVSFQLTIVDKKEVFDKNLYGTLIYEGDEVEEVNQETTEEAKDADRIHFEIRTTPRRSSNNRY